MKRLLPGDRNSWIGDRSAVHSDPTPINPSSNPVNPVNNSTEHTEGRVAQIVFLYSEASSHQPLYADFLRNPRVVMAGGSQLCLQSHLGNTPRWVGPRSVPLAPRRSAGRSQSPSDRSSNDRACNTKASRCGRRRAESEPRSRCMRPDRGLRIWPS